MPRITKVTTRRGDGGETSLGSRARTPKDALRVSAYGTVDELNSAIGVALAFGLDDSPNRFFGASRTSSSMSVPTSPCRRVPTTTPQGG